MQEILSIFKLLISSNAINFIIMLLILGWIIKKFNIIGDIEKGISGIESSILKSDEEKQKSEQVLKTANDYKEALPNELRSIKNTNKSKIKAFQNKIEESTQKAIFDIEQNVDRVISIEEKKVSNILTEKTSKASIELAKQHIEKLLALNPELHNQFIQNSIDELDRIEL